MSSAAAAAVVDLTQDDIPAEATLTQGDNVEEEEELHLLASISSSDTRLTRIVGTQYYRGEAHAGEYVKLVREPNNLYDRNAVRVDNMAGQQVGHIKKEIASILAPIMDRMPHVKLDGTIPSHGNAWCLPIKIEFFGPDPDQAPYFENLFRYQRMVRSQKKKKAAPKQATGATKANKPEVVVQTKKLDWKDQQKNLDDIFQKQCKEQLANLPDIEMPAQLTQQLFEHQVQGIRWLVHRERGTQPVPFYKQIREGGKDMWFCEITNSSQASKPEMARGAILADDMGLGKTLTTLGLVLANPTKGRDYSSGLAAPEAEVSSPMTTLVVCPVSVMGNWQSQIDLHVAPNTLRVALYHGTDRKDILNELDSIDILISSYNTLQYDFRKDVKKTDKENKTDEPPSKKFKGRSIFKTKFHRVVLDEAHICRNSKSQTFQACASLQADHRLCLTGTPLQNKPEDIQSLFSFLGVAPLGDKDVFRRAVSQPIKDGDDNGLARLRAMMAHVALRRNKSMANISLPEKTVELRAVKFPDDCKHKSIHDCIFQSAKLAFTAALQGGDDDAINHRSVFEVLTRLRQACCCGSLVPKERLEAAEHVLEIAAKKGDKLSVEEGKELLEKLKGALESDDAPPECAICFDGMDESAAVVLRTCGHVFCRVCISKVSMGYRSYCPFCRHSFVQEDLVKFSDAAAASSAGDGSNQVKLSQLEDLGPSPKMDALLLAIGEVKPGEKAVIFSQFTKFLDRIETFLESKGCSFARIDGKKTATQRIAAMKTFGQEEGGPDFMLCSLHAAGTGINLTRANHIMMMDTWWNSAVELQAFDRVHRIGQTRDVRVVRFVAADSIESRMVDLQEAKAAMGKGAFENLSKEEKKKARMGDVKRLLELDS